MTTRAPKDRERGPGTQPAAETRRLIAQSIVAVSGLSGAVFTVIHWLQDKPGRMLASLSAVVLAVVLVPMLRPGRSHRAAWAVASVYAAGMTLGLLGSETFPAGDFVWCFVVPLVVAYAGGWEMARWLLPLYIAAAATIVLAPGFAHRALWVELELAPRFLGLLGLLSAGAYLYEYARGRAQIRLLAEIEERRAAQADLTAANARLADAAVESADLATQAQAANAAKTLFLSHMSHDIRTPLTGIIGMTSLLETTALDERQRRYVKTLQASGHALNELIGDILDLARIDAGRVELAVAPVAPAELLESVCEVLLPAARARGIELRRELASTLPERVLADPARVRQVLMNLAGNAIKFTPEGRVTIRVGVRADAAPLWWRLEVEDTGIGIAPDQHRRIFESFAQVDLATTRRHQGVGLGLAICSRLVALMGGEIGLESQEGAGSRFWVDLPLSPVEAAPDVGIAEAASAPVGPQRLLLVDDSSVMREVLSAMLRQSGHSVVTAADGAAALRCLAQGPFDAALMDVQMPVMDGLEVTRRLRAVEGERATARLPVVGITALADPDTRQACLDAGMDCVVTKPVTREALARALADRLPAPGVEPPGRAGGAVP